MTFPAEHPSPDLLADLVSGSLPEAERGMVRTHLASCSRCAREVAEASAAREALRHLPEAAPPPGTAERALAAAAAAPAGSGARRGGPAWYRWGGIAAAAAVLVLIVTLVLPKVGGGGSVDRAATAAVGPEAGANSLPVRIELSPANYRSASLTELAGTAAVGPAVGSAPEQTGAATPAATPGSSAQTATATACVKRAFRQVDGTLVRLIQARFEGKPAYLALYEQSPGAGQPADVVVVRVAASAGCTPLSLAQAPLPSAGS